MASAPIIEYLRRIVAIGPQPAAKFDDAALVGRFVRDRDEEAFAEIVRRHGPMVWGVCSRALSRSHDAEDAYQATFLVLARKAASIRPPGLVANWLFGVARRTSLEAKKRRARIREQAMPEDVPAAPPTSAELRDVLDEEIGRLGERFRIPVVLCYLDGYSNAEAAQMLRCPEGTIASRLATARERLKARLTRRGLAPAVAGAAVLVPIASASAAALKPSASIPKSVSSLSNGVIRAMRIRTLTRAAAVLSCLGLVMVCGRFLLESPAQRPAAAPAVAAPAENMTPILLTEGKHYVFYMSGSSSPGWLAEERLVLKTYANGWVDTTSKSSDSITTINLAHITHIVRK